MKFHHVGIFAEDINKIERFYRKNFDFISSSKIINDKMQNIKIKFLNFRSLKKIELIAPLNKNKSNPVSNILKSKNNILNHVAYKTFIFEKDILKLRKSGCVQISKKIYSIAFKTNIVFFMTPFNYIVELIDAQKKRS